MKKKPYAYFNVLTRKTNRRYFPNIKLTQSTYMLFSEWIDKRGLTRAEAAALLGVTPTTITLWYHGKHRPNARMTTRIYEASNGRVTVNDLHRAFELARAE